MKLNRLLIFLSLLFFWACANKVPPTGGPKDKTPPVLIGSVPKDGSINVTGKEITLLFDEQVIAKNIKKELLITPRIDFDYTYKIKKNTIVFSLEEPLDSATTYTFNFRNGVVDITEGNPAVKLILAFSTGPVLDTLQITGKVQDLLTEKPSEDVIVGLYDAADTLDLFNSPPYYLSETNKSGEYTFRNLKSNAYKIYAFTDKNNNLTCQSDREQYAFLDSIIQLDTNSVASILRLQSLNIDTLELKRTRSSGKYFTAVVNKSLTYVNLHASNDSTLWYTLEDENKEIKLYNTFPIKDSLLVNLNIKDSLYQTREDSFYLSYPENQRPYDEYKVRIDNPIIYPETKLIKVSVSANKPSHLFFLDSIAITIDSLARIPFDSTWNITTNTTNTEFILKNYLPKRYLDSISTGQDPAQTSRSIDRLAERGQSKLTKKKPLNYKLYFPNAALQSIELDSTKAQSKEIKPKYSKDFGILMGNINTTYTNYVIQLLNEKYLVIDEKKPSSSYKFSHVEPGDYFIRIMIDSNGNGRWDPGNILLNQLPEPIILYKNSDGKSKTSIRANWELNLDLDF